MKNKGLSYYYKTLAQCTVGGTKIWDVKYSSSKESKKQRERGKNVPEGRSEGQKPYKKIIDQAQEPDAEIHSGFFKNDFLHL